MPYICYMLEYSAKEDNSPKLPEDWQCRDEVGEDTLIVNFDTDLTSTFFSKLYQHSGLKGGHVIMLGADQGSRWAASNPQQGIAMQLKTLRGVMIRPGAVVQLQGGHRCCAPMTSIIVTGSV